MSIVVPRNEIFTHCRHMHHNHHLHIGVQVAASTTLEDPIDVPKCYSLDGFAEAVPGPDASLEETLLSQLTDMNRVPEHVWTRYKDQLAEYYFITRASAFGRKSVTLLCFGDNTVMQLNFPQLYGIKYPERPPAILVRDAQDGKLEKADALPGWKKKCMASLLFKFLPAEVCSIIDDHLHKALVRRLGAAYDKYAMRAVKEVRRRRRPFSLRAAVSNTGGYQLVMDRSAQFLINYGGRPRYYLPGC
jgi:hypothetical protein